MELLENKNAHIELCFVKEANNIEFVEMIGGMDIYLCNKPEERDKILMEIGVKLFLNHPYFIQKKVSKIVLIKNWLRNIKSTYSRKKYKPLPPSSSGTEILSQEETDQLLKAMDYK